MNTEKNGKNLTQWLLIATVALLALVLALQVRQMFFPSAQRVPSASSAAGDPAAGLSPGKTAMVEDVQALNPALSFDALAALTAEELEQLCASGAPGMPIGVSAAAQAAEEYAGTLAVDSVTSETDPELDEAPAHYEVELHHPTLGDFEYKIDAYTAEVLEGSPDIMQSTQAAASPQEIPEASADSRPAAAAQPPAETQPPASGAPASQQPAASGEEAAKSAAFAHAGVAAADVTALRCKLDWEDGREVYDIEFWVGSTEYDYEIDAATAAVLKAQHEAAVAPSASSTPESGFIGEEAAKSAALTHAGVSAADVAFTKCELDREDGRWVYELEFWAGGTEYEYEVDASGGTVLKAEMDR